MELKLNKPIPEDTICAISTAPGMGGIAVIRISGTNAIIITDRIVYTAIRKNYPQQSPIQHTTEQSPMKMELPLTM